MTKNATNLVVQALAGTGKTTTLTWGLAKLFGPKLWATLVRNEGFEPIPSPQQSAIWEALAEGKLPRSITYAAFNRSIVNDFSAKYSWLVEALADVGVSLQFKTCHQLGFAAVCKAYKINFRQIDRFKTRTLLEEYLDVDLREFTKDEGNAVLVKAVEDLVSKCKLTMTEPSPENLDNLVNHFGIEINGGRDEAFRLVPILLDKSRDPSVCKRFIDFDDQVWLPTVNKLSIWAADLLLGDEAQDWNHAQQEIILKAGKRYCVVGDVNQAIYGFAGADVDSIPNMTKRLEATGPVKVLPLTQTRRCGKAIVKEAAKIVPSFEAHESNNPGKIESMPLEKVMEVAQDGDLLACRVNAPLCSVAFRLLKAGKKANIQGRSIGDGLVKLIDKLMGKKRSSVGDLIEAVDDWYQREAQKIARRKNADDAAMIALQDKRDCVLAFTDGALTVKEVKDRIAETFRGKQCPKCKASFNEEASGCNRCKEKVAGQRYPVPVKLVQPEGILLTSIHRAKGLEADRVFILEPGLLPHPMARTAWAKGQEINLKYVAVTRAIQNLVWVD